MSFNKVIYGGRTLIDLTADTVTEDSLLEGYTAHKADGSVITGKFKGGSETEEIDRIRFHRPSQLCIIFVGQDGSAGLEII